MTQRLRPFTFQDLPVLQSWVDNEDILFQFSAHGFTFPLTEQQFTNYMAMHTDRRFYLALDEKDDPYAFGEIIPQDAASLRLGRLLVGGEEKRGKGLGLTLVNELLDLVRTNYYVERVDLYVLENNQAAIKCYQKAGFSFTKNAPFYLEHKGENHPILTMSKTL
jgi:RimJ/RimL family protein N-acetyltransferase